MYLPDKAMTEVVIPNSSFREWSQLESKLDSRQKPNHCNEFNQFLIEDTFKYFFEYPEGKRMCHGPTLYVESKGLPALLTKNESYTFVCCGKTPWLKI